MLNRYIKELTELKKQQDSGESKTCPACGGELPQDSPMSTAAWMIRICPQCAQYEKDIMEMNVQPSIISWAWFKADGSYENIPYTEAAPEIEKLFPEIYNVLVDHLDAFAREKYSKAELSADVIHRIKGAQGSSYSLSDGCPCLSVAFNTKDGVVYAQVRARNLQGTYDMTLVPSLGITGLDELEEKFS